MNNSSHPIYPILDLNLDSSGLIRLTKREYFAGLAMNAILSNPNARKGDIEWIASSAILQADELLKQLDNE